mgnify:CR=1 FL=1
MLAFVTIIDGNGQVKAIYPSSEIAEANWGAHNIDDILKNNGMLVFGNTVPDEVKRGFMAKHGNIFAAMGAGAKKKETKPEYPWHGYQLVVDVANGVPTHRYLLPVAVQAGQVLEVDHAFKATNSFDRLPEPAAGEARIQKPWAIGTDVYGNMNNLYQRDAKGKISRLSLDGAVREDATKD